MADNLTITQGTGTTIGADEISSVKYQRVKMIVGADGTNDGDVCTGNPMPISDAGGSVTVDGTVAVTNAGITSIDGKITACNTGAVVLAAGTALIGKVGIDQSTANANEVVVKSGTTVVTQATGTNLHTVVDSGSITAVSATAANLKCEEASASAIKTAVETIDNAISGSEMQVDVVASLPAGTAIIGAVKRDTINYTAVRKYYTNAGAVTDGIVWSPASGKKWVVTDIKINVSAAATVTLEDDLSGGDSVVDKNEFAANGGMVSNLQTPWVSGEADADLMITTTAGNVYVQVSGYEI
jgi:hypothetical protein